MKPFPLLRLPHHLLKKVVFGTDLCEIVPLALMSEDIHKILRMRNVGYIKVLTYFTGGRCSIKIEFKDKSTTKMVFYHCSNFPPFKNSFFKLRGFSFKLSTTTNCSVIYTGQNIEKASVVLMESLITMFNSCKMEIRTERIKAATLENMMEYEAFNYVHHLEINKLENLSSTLEDTLLTAFSKPRSFPVLPEYRSRFLEKKNRLEETIPEKWIDELFAVACRKIAFSHFDLKWESSQFLNSFMKSWQNGIDPYFQYLRINFGHPSGEAENRIRRTFLNGINNITNWDDNGKSVAYRKKFTNSFNFGFDIKRADGQCASLIMHVKKIMDEPETHLDFITWRP